MNLGKGSGPHSLLLADNGKRLVVSNYFLNEDNFGKVHLEGDHKVRAFWVTQRGLVAVTRFQVDFNRFSHRPGTSPRNGSEAGASASLVVAGPC